MGCITDGETDSFPYSDEENLAPQTTLTAVLTAKTVPKQSNRKALLKNTSTQRNMLGL
jgi:hypothetical protein